MATSLAVLVIMLLATLCNVEGLSVVPKLDLSDDSTSIGIKPEHHKEITTPSLNPTEVKAILEVNLIHSDPKPTPEVLICSLDGKCKLHVVKSDKEDEEKEVYHPVVVSDFEVDAEQDSKPKGDDVCKKTTTTKVPVFVAHKGAVPDILPQYYPHRHPWVQETSRLPVYYGLKLGPEFRQHAPLYSRRPDIPDHFGLRYPNPYGKFFPRDGVRTIITPFSRRSNQGSVYWTTPNVVAVNDKVDLDEEMISTDSSPDEVKVVSKLGELINDTE